MTARLHRFLLRLWGTRDVRCRSFAARCRVVWGTTWRHCWDYGELRRMLGGDVDPETLRPPLLPPGTHYADAMGPFVEGLRGRVGELEEENERLKEGGRP